MIGVPLYNLPKRQREVMHFIIRHIDEWGESPTLDEIAEACKMQKTQVQATLKYLEKKGRIKRDHGAHRSITIV